jgi:hypothetical protein
MTHEQQAGALAVQEHYGLSRPATLDELSAELAMLRRRGLGNLDNSQQRLASMLGVAMRLPINWLGA